MKKNKFLTMVISFILLISATACGSNRVHNTPGDKPTIDILYLLAGHGEEYMLKICDDFNKKAQNGEYDFYVDCQSDENVGTTIDNNISVNGAYVPEIAILSTFNLKERVYTGCDAFEDISDIFDSDVQSNASSTGKMKLKEKLSKSFLDRWAIDGKYYSAPCSGGTMGIIYNKALFSKYNFQIPKTMAEMDTLINNISNIDVNINSSPNDNISAIIYPSQAISYWDSVIESFYGQYLGDDYFDFTDLKYINSDTYKSDIDSKRDVYENVYKNFNKFTNVEKGNYKSLRTSSTHTFTITEFGKNAAFMTPCGDWAYSEMMRSNSAFGDNLGIFATPLMCDDNGLVIAKATPSSKVFENIDKTNAKQVADAENQYVKIEKSKVNSNNIPQEDINSDYIYFKNSVFTVSGDMDIVVMSKSKHPEYGKEFLKYYFSDDCLNIYTKYTNTLIPEYNYVLNDDVKNNLPDFTKESFIITQNSNVLFDNKYMEKGVSYGLISKTSGIPINFEGRILKGEINYNDIVNGILSDNTKTGALKIIYPQLETKIKQYEDAMKKI